MPHQSTPEQIRLMGFSAILGRILVIVACRMTRADPFRILHITPSKGWSPTTGRGRASRAENIDYLAFFNHSAKLNPTFRILGHSKTDGRHGAS
ncbi:hypothetical protein ACFV2H_51990 [Streptomyces sp. NPDC059629]|uniref:hypothetical protein n=1 Tax=Streptomyces sp. NPDC059629 TaxID=3346889 RepID=UPI0036B60DDC